MLPDAYIAHRTDKRLRIKIPCRKEDHAYFDLVRNSLSPQEGVREVEVNPLTGSVLVMHDLGTEALDDRLRALNLFLLDAPHRGSSALYETVSSAFQAMDETVKVMSRGGLDIAGIVFAALLFSGLYQITKGNYMAPAWYTAFWYGASILMKAGPAKE